MTAFAQWWAQIRDDLGSRWTRTLVGSALYLAAVTGCLIWLGQAAVNVVLAGALLWVLVGQAATDERIEEISDEHDQTRDGLEDCKNHLWGLEPESNGKHAHRRAALEGLRATESHREHVAGTRGPSAVPEPHRGAEGEVA